MDFDRLIERVRSIHLFSALGVEIKDCVVPQIHSWDEWAGPEDPLVEKMGLVQQSLLDAMDPAPDGADWDQALQIVVEIAAQAVPYDPGEDPWYGPNTAVWFAAWTFALEEAYVSCGVRVPSEVLAQQHWYERGHWPCMLVSDSSMTSARDYVVF